MAKEGVAESHAGQIYCCLGVLAITGNLHRLRPRLLPLTAWLALRQLPSGGLNGSKLERVSASTIA